MTKHPDRTRPAVAITVVLVILAGCVLSAIVVARALFWLMSWWFDTFGSLGVLILGIAGSALVWLVAREKS